MLRAQTLARQSLIAKKSTSARPPFARAMSSNSSWSRLVRFEAEEDGKTYQGEPQLPSGSDSKDFDIGKNYAGLKVKLLSGDLYGENSVTEETKTIKKLLSPVSKEQINLFRCVGLNYVKHSTHTMYRSPAVQPYLPVPVPYVVAEGHMAGKIPEWPTLFVKGRSALANPDEPVPIPKCAQDNTMDLEAEVRDSSCTPITH